MIQPRIRALVFREEPWWIIVVLEKGAAIRVRELEKVPNEVERFLRRHLESPQQDGIESRGSQPVSKQYFQLFDRGAPFEELSLHLDLAGKIATVNVEIRFISCDPDKRRKKARARPSTDERLRVLVMPASGSWILQFLEHDMATVTPFVGAAPTAARKLIDELERRRREEGLQSWRTYARAPEEYVDRFKRGATLTMVNIESASGETSGPTTVEFRLG
jgi:hypothetical protein